MEDNNSLELSVVIPLYNEQENVLELYTRLDAVTRKSAKTYEIIFVDDGSTDRTFDIVSRIAKDDPHVLVVQLARNFGQSAALSAGFDTAKGNIIISMDGDLQHDPSDLPLFLDKIKEGYDIVSGWRKKRADNILLRQMPSFIANRLLMLVSGVKIHDFGTTYKAYRRDIIKGIELFGEYHRYIPALAKETGASIAEVPIKNINRRKGKSKYGLKRTWAVFLDIIMLKFVISYLTRPLRFFGSIGLMIFLGGVFISGTMLILWMLKYMRALIEHGAMLLFSVFLMLVGVQFIVLGILAEINSKIYYKVNNRPIYRIRRIITQ